MSFSFVICIFCLKSDFNFVFNYPEAVIYGAAKMKRSKESFFPELVKGPSQPTAASFLLLASTRWVRSTFSSHCSLSPYQGRWLTSTMPLIFSSEKISGMLGIEPGAAGSSSKYADHFATLPSIKMSLKQLQSFHHLVALMFSDLK